MKKSYFLLGLLPAVFLLLAIDFQKSPEANVAIILIDTLRYDHMDGELTPNINSFAKKAIFYENAYSQAPWTKPSVASLFTSTYPSVHGARKGLIRLSPIVDTLSDDSITLAEILRQKGYKTAAFQANSQIKKVVNFDQGFSRYLELPKENAEVINEAALKWLKSSIDSKFFIFVHYMDCHLPHFYHKEFKDLYPKSYSGRIMSPSGKTVDNAELEKIDFNQEDKDYFKALYKGEVRFVDRYVGQILNSLPEDTIVILVSDHGEELWDREDYEHGHTLYNELLHVPLIMSFPGKEAKRVPYYTRLIDVMPTILSYLKIPSGEDIQGRDVINLEEDLYVVSEATLYGEEKRSVIEDSWKYIENLEANSKELYNLKKDSGEQNNIVMRKNAAPINKLRKRLQSLEKMKKKENEEVELDEETKKQIESLGYTG